MPKKASKNNDSKKEKEIELETLSTDEVNNLKPSRSSVNMEDVKNAAEFTKAELVDKTNDDGAPMYVNMLQLLEKFNLKPFHSKKHNKFWLNGRLHTELHKRMNPAVWCRYLRRETGDTFIHFYLKPVK